MREEGLRVLDRDGVREPDELQVSPDLALVGVPLEAGAGRGGCGMGPAALRVAGLAAALGDLGLVVEDRGDIVPDARRAPIALGNARHAEAVEAMCVPLARTVHAIASAGIVPIVLGGDHALAMGSVAGMARRAADLGRPLHVLWLDAHADFNTPSTSPSGNMHGMPVAFLCGEPGFDGLRPSDGRVDPRCFHLFGIRSVDRDERQLIEARGIDVVDMRTLDEFGVAVPLKRILDLVAARDGLLHVALDVDFIDPPLAPGVGTVVPGGATFREAHLIMELLHDSGLVSSLDLVELNPYLDDRGMTARLLVDLTASLFGRRIVGRPSLARVP